MVISATEDLSREPISKNTSHIAYETNDNESPELPLPLPRSNRNTFQGYFGHVSC